MKFTVEEKWRLRLDESRTPTNYLREKYKWRGGKPETTNLHGESSRR